MALVRRERFAFVPSSFRPERLTAGLSLAPNRGARHAHLPLGENRQRLYFFSNGHSFFSPLCPGPLLEAKATTYLREETSLRDRRFSTFFPLRSFLQAGAMLFFSQRWRYHVLPETGRLSYSAWSFSFENLKTLRPRTRSSTAIKI